MEATLNQSGAGKYGGVKRSVLRNLLLSMLSFGLVVGLIFPPFARIVLDTERAYSPLFITMCIIAGLIVGFANFFIFRILVSRELTAIQNGMDHINENISVVEIMEENCLDECTLDITSADIIGDISIAFNNMAFEIFKRLELEGETRLLNSQLINSVELEDVARTILERLAAVTGSKAGLLYGNISERMELLSRFGIDNTEAVAHFLSESHGPAEQALSIDEITTYTRAGRLGMVQPIHTPG